MIRPFFKNYFISLKSAFSLAVIKAINNLTLPLIAAIYYSLNQQDINNFVIPLGDLYCVIITVYLLQLYRNRSRLLGYIDCSSPLGYLLGHLVKA